MSETVCHILRGCLFEWDADKAERNLRAHGVTFEAACEVFFDPYYEMEEDIGDHGEDRRIVIGHSYLAHPVIPVLVVAVERHEEIWRIVSARLTTNQEAQRYAEKKMDLG